MSAPSSTRNRSADTLLLLTVQARGEYARASTALMTALCSVAVEAGVEQKAEIVATRDVMDDIVTQRSANVISHRCQIDIASQQALEHGRASHQAKQVGRLQRVERRASVEQQNYRSIASIKSCGSQEQWLAARINLAEIPHLARQAI